VMSEFSLTCSITQSKLTAAFRNEFGTLAGELIANFNMSDLAFT
jgi:hypothetical protein